MRLAPLVSVAFFLFACGPSAVVLPDETGSVDAAVDAPAQTFVTSDAHVDAPVESGSCDPPEMLVILDRSDSMTSLVGNQGTRIDLAIAAIQNIVAPPTDSALRFGLQVLPAIGGAECSTQLVVPIGLGSSKAIGNALTTMSPQLDYGTPIGGALTSALATFKTTKTPNRKQFVLLVTDGGECCSCNTNDYDVSITQQLHAAGVETYVVGFGGDDDPVLLNDLACAGHTAQNFATSCTCVGVACTAIASSTASYFKASDGAALKQSLAAITNQTCCGCNVSPN